MTIGEIYSIVKQSIPNIALASVVEKINAALIEMSPNLKRKVFVTYNITANCTTYELPKNCISVLSVGIYVNNMYPKYYIAYKKISRFYDDGIIPVGDSVTPLENVTERESVKNTNYAYCILNDSVQLFQISGGKLIAPTESYAGALKVKYTARPNMLDIVSITNDTEPDVPQILHTAIIDYVLFECYMELVSTVNGEKEIYTRSQYLNTANVYYSKYVNKMRLFNGGQISLEARIAKSPSPITSLR